MSNDYPLLYDPENGIDPMHNDELILWIERTSNIVFLAIKERIETHNQIMKNQSNKIEFPVGRFVVVKKKNSFLKVALYSVQKCF